LKDSEGRVVSRKVVRTGPGYQRVTIVSTGGGNLGMGDNILGAFMGMMGSMF
jgi:hypothetical protein